jgi:hypothetical protein
MIAFWLANGISNEAHIMLARVMDGATWNMRPLDLLKTLPFISKTLISFSGWVMPGPFLPENILLVLSIIPGKNRAASNMSINPIILYQIKIT